MGRRPKVYQGRIAVITFRSQDIDEYGLQDRSIKYHSTPFSTIKNIFRNGRARIACGFSVTGDKVGVYAADSAYGSQQYAYTDKHGLSATLVMVAGCEMGKLSSGDNRCLVYANEHVVAAAFVFRPDPKPVQEWDVGRQHPAFKAHITYEWPTWYTNYVRSTWRLDLEWKVMGVGTEVQLEKDKTSMGGWRQ